MSTFQQRSDLSLCGGHILSTGYGKQVTTLRGPSSTVAALNIELLNYCQQCNTFHVLLFSLS
jgi:hypothetical protein